TIAKTFVHLCICMANSLPCASVYKLCVLCVSVVVFAEEYPTTETQRTQRFTEKTTADDFRAKPLELQNRNHCPLCSKSWANESRLASLNEGAEICNPIGKPA